MGFNFPNSPTVGQVFPPYQWDGQKWFLLATPSGGAGDSDPLMDGVAEPGTAGAYSREDHVHPSDTSRTTKTYVDTQDGLALPKTGGTMTGFITLHADPDATMKASTKQYTDARDTAVIAAEVTRANAAYQAKDPQLFAGMPLVNLASSYRLVITDAQKCFVGKAASMGFFIPTNATVPFPLGTCVTFICWVGGVISLNADSGVNAYFNLNGAVSAFPRTMSNVGMATCVKVDTDVWFCSGSGIT